MTKLTLSIVSHGQIDLVQQLLQDLHALNLTETEVILTLNYPEIVPFKKEDFNFPLRMLTNNKRQGFGQNHNQAFYLAQSAYFCILNPDLRFQDNPFADLLALFSDPKIAIVAPSIVTSHGKLEDSARKFPTLITFVKRFLFRRFLQPDYNFISRTFYPDWVAGMLMLFRSDVYRELDGFDEDYFLYCEDIDICRRARKMGYVVAVNQWLKVVHDAQRGSHKKLAYLKMHINSIFKYFQKHRAYI